LAESPGNLRKETERKELLEEFGWGTTLLGSRDTISSGEEEKVNRQSYGEKKQKGVKQDARKYGDLNLRSPRALW